MFEMDLGAKIYSTAKAAEIADVKAPTLQSWLKRYEMPEDQMPEGGGRQGQARRFSFYDIVHFTLAARLVEDGQPTEQSLNAGATFAHTAINDEKKGHNRMPGVPFTDSNGRVQTLLCLSSKGTCVVPRFDGFDWWKQANVLLGNPPGIYAMHVDYIWFDLCHRLGFRPQDVIDQEMAKI